MYFELYKTKKCVFIYDIMLFFVIGGSNNVTSGRLDNSEEQTTQNPAIFGGLIALLCFGSFFVLAILAIFGRKLFESWQRRHYSRIDYLVNGMYN